MKLIVRYYCLATMLFFAYLLISVVHTSTTADLDTSCNDLDSVFASKNGEKDLCDVKSKNKEGENENQKEIAEKLREWVQNGFDKVKSGEEQR